ncbi:MAG: hypothetical protein ACO37F_06835 [Pirellulales bacterium]
MSKSMDETHPGWQAERPDGWLVVTVDRLPAWLLGPWGATWVSTPSICRLAAAGLVCDRLLVRSTNPTDTLQELFEAHLPVAGQAGNRSSGLLEAAESRGWRTAIVTDAVEHFGGLLAAGPTVEVLEVPSGRPKRTAATDEASGCGRVFTAAEAVLVGGEADLVWCHLGSLGTAWDAPQGYREACFDPDDPPPDDSAVIPDFVVTAETDPDRVMAVRQTFAGELAHFDDWIGRLLDGASRRWRRAGVLLLGLRGLPLGLHGRVGAGVGEPAPFAELTHVPAVLVDPAGRQASQRFGGLLLPADLVATATELIGGVAHADGGGDKKTAGRSLAALFGGEAAAWRTAGRDRIYSHSAGGQAINVGDWTLVQPVDQPPRLFAKPDDYFELADVADRSRDVAAALASCLVAPDCQAEHWEKPLPKLLWPDDTSDRYE